MKEPDALIENLLYVGNVVLLHGAEESFKSIFIAQFAESLTTAQPFLRTYKIPHPFKVGLVETEIDGAFLGTRLRKMFPSGPPPNLFIASNNALKDFRRAVNIHKKLLWLREFIDQTHLDILIIDVVNDFFRGDESTSKEQDVGKLFEGLRSMDLKAILLVRHDKKFQYNAAGYEPPSSNEHIRGSGEWKEDPELILWLHRLDKRTNDAEMEVGKMRYGRKPEVNPMPMWFDAGTFRMTPLPPLIALLEEGPKTRETLLTEAKQRFQVGQVKLDSYIRKATEAKWVLERQVGHQKEFALDYLLAHLAEPWGHLLRRPSAPIEIAA